MILRRIVRDLLGPRAARKPEVADERRELVLVLMCPSVGRHREVFQEVIEVVAAGLGELGYTTSMHVNEFVGGRDHIVFGPRMLRAEDVDRVPGSTILYNFEPLNVPVHDERRAFITHYAPRFRVWDYSVRNVGHLASHGISAQHVPLGYAACLTRIDNAQNQDIDVLFYGEATPRREHVLQGLRAAGLGVCAVTDCYVQERDSLIARAKVVLNVHRDDEIDMLETPRVYYLLANRKAVVTEANAALEIDGDVRSAMAAVPYDALVDACIALVRDAAGRARLEAAGFECIRRRPESAILAGALGGGK